VRRRYAGGRTALCCASEGELHEVAVLCLQILLESDGWRVRNLGGNTPFFALADAVARHRPALVCVSSTMGAELERSSREFPQLRAAVEAAGGSLVLGGEGYRDAAVRRRMPADLHAESFTELQEFLTDEAANRES
jgi:methanogenic corrinoid protein MtbC1